MTLYKITRVMTLNIKCTVVVHWSSRINFQRFFLNFSFGSFGVNSDWFFCDDNDNDVWRSVGGCFFLLPMSYGALFG